MRGRLALLLVLLGLASCRHVTPPAPLVAARVRVFLESTETGATDEVLPQSGIRIPIRPVPLLTETDFTDVSLGELDLGKCLLFQLTPRAAAELHRIAPASAGRRLVLVVNDVPLGARRLDGAMGGGPLAIYVEVPDAYLPRLLATIKPPPPPPRHSWLSGQ